MGKEWALVLFTVLVGLGAGTFVSVAVCELVKKASEVRVPGAIVALVALPLGGFASLLHLGHPERMFGALGHPTSGIFMEALMIGLTMVGIIAYLIAIRKQAADRTRVRIAVTASIPALILAFAVGDTYVMTSRPAWNTLMLPLVYVTSAASMGFFCIFLLAAKFSEHVSGRMKNIAYAVLGVQAVVLIAYLVAIAVAPFHEPSRSVARVLAGDLAPLFWIGIVALGLLVPFWIARRKWLPVNLPSFALMGLLGTVAGALSFRMLMFSLGTGIIQMMPGTVLF